MLISAKATKPISFFFHEKMRNRYLGNNKNTQFEVLKWQSRKTKCWVPFNPSPYAVKCLIILSNQTIHFFSVLFSISNPNLVIQLLLITTETQSKLNCCCY